MKALLVLAVLFAFAGFVAAQAGCPPLQDGTPTIWDEAQNRCVPAHLTDRCGYCPTGTDCHCDARGWRCIKYDGSNMVCPAGCTFEFIGGPGCYEGPGYDDCAALGPICFGSTPEPTPADEFAHCENGVKDEDETGVDCGGSCLIEDDNGEVFEEVCADGIDNDADCFVDCADPDCSGSGNPMDVSPECGCMLYYGEQGSGMLDIAIIGQYGDVYGAADRETNFKGIVDGIIDDGFAKAEPFASNMGKINFWITLTNDSMSERQSRKRCPNADQYIFLSNTRSVSEAEIGGKNAYVVQWYSPLTPYVMHEFGHSFGGLWDEYEYGTGVLASIGFQKHRIWYDNTNCYVPDIITDLGNLQDDCRWYYGGIVQQGGMWPLQCVKGCTSPDWYRSENCSIMRQEDGGCGVQYNEVSQAFLRERLGEYT